MATPRPSVLIAHVYNEAYLLPWWIRHHVGMFDEGVIIDYASTDGSMDIVRKLAPHWKIMSSQHQAFDAMLCDQEVMAIERTYDNHWKMVLNVTEFLCVRDMKSWLASLEQHGWEAYGIRTAIMVDAISAESPDLDPDQPLVSQRHHGYFEEQHLIELQPFFSRCRIIHRMEDGAYCMFGRHVSTHRTYIHPAGALLKFCLYSPMNAAFLNRKLQIGDRVSAQDLKHNSNIHHRLDLNGHQRRYSAEARKSSNLMHYREYADVMGDWRERSLARTLTGARYPAAPGVMWHESGDAPSYSTMTLLQAILQQPSYIFKIGLEHWARTQLDRDITDLPAAVTLAFAVLMYQLPHLSSQASLSRVREAYARLHRTALAHPRHAPLWWMLALLLDQLDQPEDAQAMRALAVQLCPEVFSQKPSHELVYWEASN